MFSKHVGRRLSAYCTGDISNEESRRIAEHLIGCERCRKEHEEIKLGVLLAQQLPLVTAPDEIWDEIQRLLPQSAKGPSRRRFRLPTFGVFGLAAATALIVAAVGGVILWRALHHPTQPPPGQANAIKTGPSWEVQTLAGVVTVGTYQITDKGKIGVGDALETNGDAKARITVGDIGHVEVLPNSEVRLIDASSTQNRLGLEHGTIKAKVIAPPRLFFVNTPSAEAIDLGCEYTLEVDDLGRSFLHVSLGYVALVREGGAEIIVPRYAMCQTRPVIGPGTPYFEDATAELVRALEQFDFENGGEQALSAILLGARKRDTFTLWNLLPRVNQDERQLVVERMIQLVGLPKGVTRAGAMRLDQRMLDRWSDALDTIWYE